MRSELRTALATIATLAVVLGSATMALADDGDTQIPTTPETSEPTAPEPTDPTPPEPTDPTFPEPTPSPEVPSGAFTVSDAELRWGFNDESNNRAFAPGTVNFFSAGTIANPGKGGVALKESGWSQASGKVRIEKFSAVSKTYKKATWDGLRTDSTGRPMTGTNGPFSNHQIAISGGTGTVDPAARSGTIQWKGSFTVLYYSGYSFFYVTDPRLTVRKGVGTLTATLSGYGSSMEDLSRWEAIKPVPNVVLANLGTVDLDKKLGFEATPKYAGVSVKVGSTQVPQVRSGSSWGSFPQSFIDYQAKAGSAAYWYSSGGSADAHKKALPLTISYSAGAPVNGTTPGTSSGGNPDVDNTALNAPGLAPPAVSSPLAVLTAPPASDDPLGEALTQSRPVSTVMGVSHASDPTSRTPVWALGGVLMVLTVLVGASPFTYSALRRTSISLPSPADSGTSPER